MFARGTNRPEQVEPKERRVAAWYLADAPHAARAKVLFIHVTLLCAAHHCLSFSTPSACMYHAKCRILDVSHAAETQGTCSVLARTSARTSASLPVVTEDAALDYRRW
jgi:hypothetical protein